VRANTDRAVAVETHDGPIAATPRALTEPDRAEPVDWVLATTKPEDGSQVAWAGDGRGCKDQAEDSSFNELVRSRGGKGGRLPAPHVAAAG
jgi:hypothetical protein